MRAIPNLLRTPFDGRRVVEQPDASVVEHSNHMKLYDAQKSVD